MKKTESSRHNYMFQSSIHDSMSSCMTYKHRQTVVTCTGPAQFKSDWVPILRGGSGHELLSLNNKLFPITIYFQRKNLFSPVKSHWVYRPHFRPGRTPRHRRSTQNGLGIFVDFLSYIALLGQHFFLPYWPFAYKYDFWRCMFMLLRGGDVCMCLYYCFVAVVVCLTVCFLKINRKKWSWMDEEAGRILKDLGEGKSWPKYTV